MTNSKIILLVVAVAVVAFGLGYFAKTSTTASPSTSEVQGTIGKPATETTEINPFTNVATIPATVDPSTIRFEKLKTVSLASKTKTTTDTENCKERQFRESDVTCQSVQVLEKVNAVEARYSYAGPVVSSSGEAIPGRDEFSVYFHPEDLSAAGPVNKLNREQGASLFEMTTSRPTVDEKVIDKAHSQFCDGNYVDGNWTRKDPNCQDHVVYMNQSVASPYLMVQVNVRRPASH